MNAGLIPDVNVPAGFFAQGWRATGLDGWSAGIEYTIHGGASDETDASARALIAKGALEISSAPVLHPP